MGQPLTLQHQVNFVLQEEVLQITLQPCQVLKVDRVSGRPHHLPVQTHHQPRGPMAIHLQQQVAQHMPAMGTDSEVEASAVTKRTLLGLVRMS